MNTFCTIVDLVQFGSKISYKVPGPTPICVKIGFTVHRLASNLCNNHHTVDRRDEWKHGNKIILCFRKSIRSIIYLFQDKR